jgi:hypothetical protein
VRAVSRSAEALHSKYRTLADLFDLHTANLARRAGKERLWRPTTAG